MKKATLPRRFRLSMPMNKHAIAYLALILCGLFSTERAAALTANEALENCRASIGRPVVRACVQQRMQRDGGFPQQHVPGCRQIATPAVRSCFQNAMSQTIAGCRASVGKPIVEACVQARIATDGRFRIEQIQDCRKTAFGPVRACIWRTSSTGGEATTPPGTRQSD